MKDNIKILEVLKIRRRGRNDLLGVSNGDNAYIMDMFEEVLSYEDLSQITNYGEVYIPF